MEALEWVGLTEHANKKPDKLSGGESQRVAMQEQWLNLLNLFWLMNQLLT